VKQSAKPPLNLFPTAVPVESEYENEDEPANLKNELLVPNSDSLAPTGAWRLNAVASWIELHGGKDVALLRNVAMKIRKRIEGKREERERKGRREARKNLQRVVLLAYHHAIGTKGYYDTLGGVIQQSYINQCSLLLGGRCN